MPEDVVREIARYRVADKPDPEYYARLTVTKAVAELERSQQERKLGPESTPSNDPLDHQGFAIDVFRNSPNQ